MYNNKLQYCSTLYCILFWNSMVISATAQNRAEPIPFIMNEWPETKITNPDNRLKINWRQIWNFTDQIWYNTNLQRVLNIVHEVYIWVVVWSADEVRNKMADTYDTLIQDWRQTRQLSQANLLCFTKNRLHSLEQHQVCSIDLWSNITPILKSKNETHKMLSITITNRVAEFHRRLTDLTSRAWFLSVDRNSRTPPVWKCKGGNAKPTDSSYTLSITLADTENSWAATLSIKDLRKDNITAKLVQHAYQTKPKRPTFHQENRTTKNIIVSTWCENNNDMLHAKGGGMAANRPHLCQWNCTNRVQIPIC